MYTTTLETYKDIIRADFENHILTHNIRLANTVSNGMESAGAWYDSDIELMSEVMVYGTKQYAMGTQYTGSSIVQNYNFTVEKRQLKIYEKRHDLISAGENWWLRDVVGTTSFAEAHFQGNSDRCSAELSRGIMPSFCIY